MQAIQMHVENTVAHAKEEMGIQKTGRNEMPLSTFRLDHEGQSFLRNRRQKGGKVSAVTVPAPYRPTGARFRLGPVLTTP
jgi:hypothetical protein